MKVSFFLFFDRDFTLVILRFLFLFYVTSTFFLTFLDFYFHFFETFISVFSLDFVSPFFLGLLFSLWTFIQSRSHFVFLPNFFVNFSINMATVNSFTHFLKKSIVQALRYCGPLEGRGLKCTTVWSKRLILKTSSYPDSFVFQRANLARTSTECYCKTDYCNGAVDLISINFMITMISLTFLVVGP